MGLGAGGHAKVLIELLRGRGWEIVGLTDTDAARWGGLVLGVPVLGGDEELTRLGAGGRRSFDAAFVAVGTPRGDTGPRRRAWDLLRRHGFEVIGGVHPTAVISPSATLGPGAQILAGAIVQADARVGANVLVNDGVIVEHDDVIGDHAHLASGARLAGGVTIGEGAHVGLGAVVREGTRVGRNAIVGAGAVVLTDVPDGAVVVGVPARVIRTTKEPS